MILADRTFDKEDELQNDLEKYNGEIWSVGPHSQPTNSKLDFEASRSRFPFPTGKEYLKRHGARFALAPFSIAHGRPNNDGEELPG